MMNSHVKKKAFTGEKLMLFSYFLWRTFPRYQLYIVRAVGPVWDKSTHPYTEIKRGNFIYTIDHQQRARKADHSLIQAYSPAFWTNYCARNATDQQSHPYGESFFVTVKPLVVTGRKLQSELPNNQLLKISCLFKSNTFFHLAENKYSCPQRSVWHLMEQLFPSFLPTWSCWPTRNIQLERGCDLITLLHDQPYLTRGSSSWLLTS